MNKLKKILLLVVAIVLFGITANTAQASCMVTVTQPDGSNGFVSCGSTAGNYMGTCSGGVCREVDAPGAVAFICAWYCDM